MNNVLLYKNSTFSIIQSRQFIYIVHPDIIQGLGNSGSALYKKLYQCIVDQNHDLILSLVNAIKSNPAILSDKNMALNKTNITRY